MSDFQSLCCFMFILLVNESNIQSSCQSYACYPAATIVDSKYKCSTQINECIVWETIGSLEIYSESVYIYCYEWIVCSTSLLKVKFMMNLSMHLHAYIFFFREPVVPHLPLASLRNPSGFSYKTTRTHCEPPSLLAKWGPGGPREVPGNFRPEERKASVYSEGWRQNGLCLLKAFIYFHTSLRPLTPVWSQRTGRNVLFFHGDWPQSLAGRLQKPRTSQSPGMTAHSRPGTRTTPLPEGHTCVESAGSLYSLTRLSVSGLLVSSGVIFIDFTLSMYNLYPKNT